MRKIRCNARTLGLFIQLLCLCATATYGRPAKEELPPVAYYLTGLCDMRDGSWAPAMGKSRQAAIESCRSRARDANKCPCEKLIEVRGPYRVGHKEYGKLWRYYGSDTGWYDEKGVLSCFAPETLIST